MNAPVTTHTFSSPMYSDVLLRGQVTDLSHHRDDETKMQSVSRTIRGLSLQDEMRNLYQNGPVWVGDCISHKTKELLVYTGLAVNCVVRGQDGYTAMTPLGAQVMRFMLKENIG